MRWIDFKNRQEKKFAHRKRVSAIALLFLFSIPTPALHAQELSFGSELTEAFSSFSNTDQNLSWGVLALNPNKAVYRPYEEASIDIAVLNHKGQQVCTASMDLVVTGPNGYHITKHTWKIHEIEQNAHACKKKGYTDKPDFFTTITLGEAGTYTATLTARTPNGERTVTDTWYVEDDPPFIIERESATRIYPKSSYDMHLRVTPKQDFAGIVRERMPRKFTLKHIGDGGREEENLLWREIAWEVNWQAGQMYELSYTFNPPRKHPEFHTLGPLVLTNENQAYTEKRAWQLAIDAVADIGIWVDQNGSLQATTSFVKFPFEGSGNEVRNDGIYTYNTSTDDVTVSEAGNYLVLYYLRNDINNARHGVQARVTLNGTAVAGSHGGGYARNSANDEQFTRGAGLVLNASANDEIAVEWRQDADNGETGTIAGQSELMIVRLPDDADVAYGHYGTPSTNTLGGTTWNDVGGLDAIRQTDTSVIELQGDQSNIRLKPANTNFLIIYGLPLHGQTTNNRAQRIGRAVSGSTEIPQSSSYSYLRDQDNEFGALYSMFVYRTSGANEDISIQGQRGSSNADNGVTLMTGAGEAGVFVMELPSSAEVFISEDGTGGQRTSGGITLDLNLMRTATHNDASSFTRFDNTTMDIEQDMDVLLTAGCRTDRSDQASGSRFTLGARFEIEGTDQTRGQHGMYTRGNQGTHDTFNGSINPAGIFTVSTNDSVQVETFDLGDNGSQDDTIAGACGFSALNLDTLTAAIASTNSTFGQMLFPGLGF